MVEPPKPSELHGPFDLEEEMRTQTHLLMSINAKLTFFTMVLVAGIIILALAEIYRY